MVRLDLRFADSARDGDERGQAGTVVGNPRGAQALGVATNLYVGAWRKDGVEVCGEHHDFSVVCTREFTDDVAGFVDLYVQAGFGEKNFDCGGARRFLKRRRGNFGDAYLLIVDPSEISGEPGQRRAEFRGFSELQSGDGTVRGARRANGHDRKDNPKEKMFHRGVPQRLGDRARGQLRAGSCARA
jgi:hypothetical protein